MSGWVIMAGYTRDLMAREYIEGDTSVSRSCLRGLGLTFGLMAAAISHLESTQGGVDILGLREQNGARPAARQSHERGIDNRGHECTVRIEVRAQTWAFLNKNDVTTRGQSQIID